MPVVMQLEIVLPFSIVFVNEITSLSNFNSEL